MDQTTCIRSKVDLNSAHQINTGDPEGMFQALWNLPEQCAEAFKIATKFSQPNDYKNVHAVIISGLGGSAIGGDLLRVCVANKSTVPVIVNRDYTLPAFVGEQILVIAVSYSGNTEETLSAYAMAQKNGAKIIALTSGGKLKELAMRDGVPVVTVPGGLQPRAATSYLFIPALVIMAELGFIPTVNDEISNLITEMQGLREQYQPEMPIADNLAKQIAQKLFNKTPLIWGSCSTTEVAAIRWKGQINENSKSAAYWNNFPELNHNEIVGFEMPEALLKNLEVIILRDEADHERVKQRMEITKSIIEGKVSGITEVFSKGTSLLTRLYSLNYIGDYASIYLALLYGVNPTPVKMIDLLKNELMKIKS